MNFITVDKIEMNTHLFLKSFFICIIRIKSVKLTFTDHGEYSWLVTLSRKSFLGNCVIEKEILDMIQVDTLLNGCDKSL